MPGASRPSSASSIANQAREERPHYLIQASPETRGHGTTWDAKFWKHLLPALLGDATLAGQ